MGEQVARNIYPETTIVRPAPMFGFEDNLLHKLAGVTNLFTANHMKERFWPVHVREKLVCRDFWLVLMPALLSGHRCWSRP